MSERSECWECLRRKSPCDGTMPICRQCQQSKIVCPGYGDRKPLTWLPMGMITRPSKASVKRLAKVPPLAALRTGKRKDVSPKTSTEPTAMNFLSEESDDAENGGTSSQVGIMGERRADEQKVMTSIARRKRMDQIYAMRTRDLRPQEWDCVDLVNCWNSMVLSKFRPKQLASSSQYDDRLDISTVQHMSLAHRHCLIAVSFGFRIGLVSLTQGIDLSSEQSSSISPLRASAYRYIGHALREVNNDLCKFSPVAYPGDVNKVLTAIYSLIVAELLLSKSPQWRGHAAGFLALMKHYGGIHSVLRATNGRFFHLQTFIVQVTLHNTTCPWYAQIEEVTNFDIKDLERVFNLSVYPLFYGPATLFLSVVRINRLRIQLRDPSAYGEFSLCDVLGEVENCNIEAWIQSNDLPKTRDHLLVVQAIKAAVLLYASLALRFASALRCTGSCLCQRPVKEVRNTLFEILEEVIERGVVPKSVSWPIIVAGAAAVTAQQRIFVEKCLSLATRDPFTGVGPCVTLTEMRRFWESGKTDWDSFLEPPYAMLIV